MHGKRHGGPVLRAQKAPIARGPCKAARRAVVAFRAGRPWLA